MKLALVITGEVDDKRLWSGIVYNLTEALKRNGNVEIIPINLKNLLKRSVPQRVLSKVIYIRNSTRDPWRYYHDSTRIETAIRETKADICLFVPEFCLRKWDGKIKCYTYTDAILQPLLEANPPRRLWWKQFMKRYDANEKICLEKMEGIFTLNEWSKECMSSFYGIEHEKIHNIGFGINTPFYTGVKDYSKKKLLIVLRKGTEYYKGLDLLLEAFQLIHLKDPEISLSVVGTEYKPMEGVTYYFNRPRELTIELFQQASLYVMPSVSEPNGITYLEALASKTPIVGLKRFAFPEFTGYGKYGFAVENYDANDLAQTILDAFKDFSRLEIMGMGGQDFVRNKYTWDKVAEMMLGEFNRALNNKFT